MIQDYVHHGFCTKWDMSETLQYQGKSWSQSSWTLLTTICTWYHQLTSHLARDYLTNSMLVPSCITLAATSNTCEVNTH